MSEKRFTVDKVGIYDNQEKKHFKFIAYDWIDCDIYKCCDLLNELYDENEQLRKRLKGDNYMMVSEMVSNLRKTDICDGCKNKDKPAEWYMERGFSITGRVCDRYEPED